MSKNSDSVKKWRKNTKDRIIDVMGGGCCVCGYNKSQRSLALHHLDPDEKELSFASLRASPMCWDSIVAELRKCVLVCSNCHGEIHDNITKIPTDAPKFNENYANYREVLKVSKYIKCPVCDDYMSPDHKTCSRRCAAKQTGKVNWDEINLAVLLQTKSYTVIADELGISDASVHKRAKKIGLK